SNKYKNTLAEFCKEDNEIIENNPLTAIIQNYIIEKMRNDLNLSISTSPRMPTTPSTLPLTPSTPLPIYSTIHTITFESNIESLCILPNSTIDIVASHSKYLMVTTDNENGRIIMFKTFNTINCSIDDQQNNINKNEDITSSILIQLANFYDIPSPESSPISSSPTILSIAIQKFTYPRLLWLCKNNSDSKISNSESDNDKLSGHSDVVREMWYNEERDLLITCGFDKYVKIWGSNELCRELMKDLKEGEKKRNQEFF
ncbi:36226_t:CDS:2, partial [Racocetra persica]